MQILTTKGHYTQNEPIMRSLWPGCLVIFVKFSNKSVYILAEKYDIIEKWKEGMLINQILIK